MFLVDRLPENYESLDASWVVVEDVLKALQSLAAFHRQQFRYAVAAITGSNGKTMVKEWLYQVVHRQYNTIRSPRSYNSQIGVPISVLQMEGHHELAIFEAGISQAGEMHRLQEIIRPDIGIFTNIGDAHASGFESQEQKIREKLMLFRHAKTLVACTDHPLLKKELQNFARANDIKLIGWSAKSDRNAGVHFEVVKQQDHTILQLKGSYRETEMSIPFTDDASIENACHVWLASRELNISEENIQLAFQRLTPIEMRLNQKAAFNNCNLISDFYNADLTSVSIALNWADRQHRGQNKTIVLSDIEQSDLEPKILYAQINQMLEQHHYGRLIGIGDTISAHAELFTMPDKQFYPATDDFLQALDDVAFENETILLKGGRRFEFEKIEKRLQRQVHNTLLEINMNALQHNLNFFKQQLKPDARMMVMVKAYSYGSGGHEIAHFLQFHGVQYLAVAYADEGVSLRKDGIKLPIMVMNADADSFNIMIQHQLEPEIFSPNSLNQLLEVLHQSEGASCKIHIELNSGMNRLGFDEADIDVLCCLLEAHPQIVVESVFSHLASSDIPDARNYTLEQIHRFNAMYDTLCNRLNIKPLKHILNTTGILHFPEAQYDMVRLGIGLYGIDPSGQFQHQLEQIGTLWSTISQIREVEALDGVGYGKHSPSKTERRIAVVAIGYADGLSRGLGQGKGYFVINGKPAPIVGNICMDMTMCDVTDITCREGDPVQVFGNDPSIQHLSQVLHTIPYEILTSVSQRVKRVFTEE